MGIVRKHLAFEELTPTLLREMIEKIVVHECSYDENGTRRQDIVPAVITMWLLPGKRGLLPSPDRSITPNSNKNSRCNAISIIFALHREIGCLTF